MNIYQDPSWPTTEMWYLHRWKVRLHKLYSYRLISLFSWKINDSVKFILLYWLQLESISVMVECLLFAWVQHLRKFDILVERWRQLVRAFLRYTQYYIRRWEHDWAQQHWASVQIVPVPSPRTNGKSCVFKYGSAGQCCKLVGKMKLGVGVFTIKNTHHFGHLMICLFFKYLCGFFVLFLQNCM